MSEDKPKRFKIPHPGVLLAVGLVLVVIAVGLRVWVPYHREQLVVREIERIGGMVGYYYPPEWLLDWANDEWMKSFDGVYTVGLASKSIRESDLKRLGDLMNLRVLDLAAVEVSGGSWKQLSGLTDLEWLMLHETTRS